MKQKLQYLTEVGEPLPFKKSSFGITGNKVVKSQEYNIDPKAELMETSFCEICKRKGLYRIDDPICVACRVWYR